MFSFIIIDFYWRKAYF